MTTAPWAGTVCRQSNVFPTKLFLILFSSRNKKPSSNLVFLLFEPHLTVFPRHSALIYPADAGKLTTKPRGGVFRRQFFRFHRKVTKLEMKKLNRPAPWAAGTWCTNSRKALLLRSLCTKSQARFAPWPAGTWCTKPRKALFLRSLCTKFQAIFGAGPAGLGARIPAKPCASVSFAPSLRPVSASRPPGSFCGYAFHQFTKKV